MTTGGEEEQITQQEQSSPHFQPSSTTDTSTNQERPLVDLGPNVDNYINEMVVNINTSQISTSISNERKGTDKQFLSTSTSQQTAYLQQSPGFFSNLSANLSFDTLGPQFERQLPAYNFAASMSPIYPSLNYWPPANSSVGNNRSAVPGILCYA